MQGTEMTPIKQFLAIAGEAAEKSRMCIQYTSELELCKTTLKPETAMKCLRSAETSDMSQIRYCAAYHPWLC
jgi:hypothetical protein